MSFGVCHDQTLPKPSDDCVAHVDSSCDGTLPPACTGALAWTRFAPNDGSRAVGFTVDGDDHAVLTTEENVCDPNNQMCMRYGAARAFQADGDLLWRVIDDCAGCITTSGAPGLDASYGLAFALNQGNPQGSAGLSLEKRQGTTGVVAWSSSADTSQVADAAVASFRDRAWIATTATSSVDLDGDGKPDLPAPSIVLRSFDPQGNATHAAAYFGRARGLAVGASAKDATNDTSVVLAACFTGHASLGPSCAVDEPTGKSFDGYIAELEATPGTKPGAPLDCAWIKAVRLGAAEGSCHVRVALDDGRRVTFAATSENRIVAGRFTPDGASDTSFQALDATIHGSSESIGLAALALDPFGNPLVAANFKGDIALGATMLSSSSSFAGAVLKLSAVDGTLVWSRMVFGASDVAVSGIGGLSNGDVAVGGSYGSSLYAEQAPTASPTELAGSKGSNGVFVRAIAP